jgi:hypothetical protein
MPKVIKLSTEEKVHLKEKWTHKLQKTFDAELFRDSEKLRPENIVAAYEAVLPLVVERIEPDRPYGQQWLDELPQDDYKLLVAAVDGISVTDAGKKNP